MDQKNDFLRRILAEWYGKNTVEAPPFIEKREFGAGVEKKIDFRHLAFKDEKSFNNYLRMQVPFYISFSAGEYEFPDARPMPRKNLIGADLIFDLDADEYDNPCSHPKDEVCEICMSRVKQELFKLIENFLIPDFGFTKNDLKLTFSGNRGYHIHIRKEEVQSLSQNARKELLDYIFSSHFNPYSVGLKQSNGRLVGPTTLQGGWGGKIAREVISILNDDYRTVSKRLGLSVVTSKKLLAHKENVVRGIQKGDWDQIRLPDKSWEKAFKLLALDLSAEVDKGVTMDVSRLIRCPGTIHGGTGLCAIYVDDLEKFDAFKDPIVLGENKFKLIGKKNLEFVLNDQTFEVKENEEIVLPEYAAFYAVAKEWCSV